MKYCYVSVHGERNDSWRIIELPDECTIDEVLLHIALEKELVMFWKEVDARVAKALVEKYAPLNKT